MKDLFGALLIALFILGIHAIAAVVITYAPWLGIVLFAWVWGAIILALLSELGVTTIDLSKLRNR
jgi:hypothetical protein